MDTIARGWMRLTEHSAAQSTSCNLCRGLTTPLGLADVPPPLRITLSGAWRAGASPDAMALYARWWQLETWLRSVVSPAARDTLQSLLTHESLDAFVVHLTTQSQPEFGRHSRDAVGAEGTGREPWR